MKIRANYYRQFDADYSLDVPAEGYGGWTSEVVDIDPRRVAVVSMHAWDCGTYGQYPGWWRCIEYIERSHEICRTVYPRLLQSVRDSDMQLMHVVRGQDYYTSYPGYQRAAGLAEPDPAPPEFIAGDPVLAELWKLKGDHGFVGQHNRADLDAGTSKIDFPAEAKPQGDEGVARNGEQLFALCKEAGINHLVYVGFAINWCLLISPGGMIDMSKRGFMCSTIPEAVTAVENRETARDELCKKIALWRVAVAYGFVFGLDDFLAALGSGGVPREPEEAE